MLRLMRGASFTAAAIAMVLTSGSVVAWASDSRASARTVVHVFAGFQSGRIAPGLTVTARQSGTCGSPTFADPRAYSWRCFSANYVLDPCFSSTARSRTVVCPGRPWGRTVIVLRMVAPFTAWKRPAPRLSYPWGIWTTTGKRCYSLAGGTFADVDSEFVTFACLGGGILVGYVDTKRQPWSIEYVAVKWLKLPAGNPHLPMARVSITDVWT